MGFVLQAQHLTPQQVQYNLYKSYNRIDYWDRQTSEVKDDSLAVANDKFRHLLQMYGKQYPFLLQQSFEKFKGMDVATSPDGLLRIYSWDTWTGGTMHFFDHVIQFKTGNNTQTLVMPSEGESDSGYYYPKIFTTKLNGRTYYLVDFEGIGSTKYVGEGIRIFAIENGRLNTEVKLIKTYSGLYNQLYEAFNFLSVVDWKVRPSIRFNASTNTIYIPLVDSKENMTHRYISYKFTGKYFEKVKS